MSRITRATEFYVRLRRAKWTPYARAGKQASDGSDGRLAPYNIVTGFVT